jgi:hypothetical protein
MAVMNDQRMHVQQGRAVGMGPLWFGFLGGIVAWGVQLLGNYFLVTLDCTTETDLTLIVDLVSLVMLVIALLALLVAWRNWQLTGTDEAYGARTVVQRGGFMARFGLFANALFAVLILFTGVTALVLPACT